MWFLSFQSHEMLGVANADKGAGVCSGFLLKSAATRLSQVGEPAAVGELRLVV